MSAATREACLRCWRPPGHCWCGLIPHLPTRTHVVFLQHPRESKVPIGTARMAHLALPRSELHEGVSFAGRADLEALARDPEAAVLFPGADESADAAPPRILFVVDGTWPQARKLIRKNPILAGMRRVGLKPTRPSAYRIRREPAADCLATVEAVAAVLAQLEDEPERFEAMLRAFHFMVEQQLAYAASTQSAPRRRSGPSPKPPLGPELRALRDAPEQALLVHAEANAQGPGERTPGTPELVHLVASRAGRRFEAFLAPRRPLGSRTAHNLGVEASRLTGGADVATVIAQLEAFAGPDARVCGWGGHAAGLLAEEGFAARPRVDVRAVHGRRFPGSGHGLDGALAALQVTPGEPWAQGRAGRMIAKLEAAFAALLLLA